MEGFDRGDTRTASGVLFGWAGNLLIICPACPQRSFSRYMFRWEIAVLDDNFLMAAKKCSLCSFLPQEGPAMCQMVGRVSVKNGTLGILNLNPSHSPYSALFLMTGSQWTQIKWQANIFFPQFLLGFGVRETWIAQVAPQLLNADLRECDTFLQAISQSSPHSLAAGTHHICLAVTSAVASERGFNNAECKVIRNTIALTSTQILNYYISLRWAELWVVFHWLIYVGNPHSQIIFTNKLGLGMTQKLLLLLGKCFLLWLLFLGMLHTKQYISHMKQLPWNICCQKVCLELAMMDEFLTGNCNSDQMQADLVARSSQFIKITIDLFKHPPLFSAPFRNESLGYGVQGSSSCS